MSSLSPSPRRRAPRAAWPAACVAAGLVGACAAPEGPATLKDLERREVVIAPDRGLAGRGANADAAYRAALAAAPREPLRREVLRRLGDLEMDRIDNRIAAEGEVSAADYRAAIVRYEAYLKAYPNDPGNDHVLYQLSRAHELGGQLEAALGALDRLVQGFPRTRYRDEVQFRRGELLFTLRDYDKAERAFALTKGGGATNPYQERSLYMHGWSLFKQGRVDEALQSFFGVLDLKLADAFGRSLGDGELESLPALTRADRELVEDTFRVSTLCLENLKGVASISEYITSARRRDYEFRVYQQLAELYVKQDRSKDAADTFAAFALRQPAHPQAPVFQARVIDIYERGGFAMLALQAKQDFVAQYSAGAGPRSAAWNRAQPLVKAHLADLARHYHAAAQKSRRAEDYQQAVRWYRAVLAAYPTDPLAAQNNFLLAELLYEDGKFPEAAVEYEKAAYGYARHARSADAGYAALLAYAQLEKRAAATELPALQRTAVASATRFAREFAQDARRGSVLTNASEKLFTLRDGDQAAALAQQVVALVPPAAAGERRVAWTVIAHTAFERASFGEAEVAYRQVLALSDKDTNRGALTERLAASIYKQGEAARDVGALREAVAHFSRLATAVPDSPARAAAQYDTAAAQIALKDWDAAARTLEDFRQRFPRHTLQPEVSGKLAVVYSEKGDWPRAAGEFEQLAATNKDPQLAREGLWHAAELYEKARARPAAIRLYERYLKLYPQPLESAVEARYRLARAAQDEGNAARALALMREVHKADLAGAAARTDRTRYLGATAALALAQPLADEYRKVALVEPLKQSLRVKKAKMETALKAYAAAAEYGVADVATAATFHTAEIYRDFGRAMLTSQRPRGLKKDELEQYDVLLEEQAFPFEEKAIELHELNAVRVADGIYDRWVRDSLSSLARLRPARYAKTERGEGVIDAIR